MLLPPAPPAPFPALDADQARAAGHRGGALLVRGAAGTGKTTTAVAIVLDRIDEGVLLLAPTRRAAARLRDQVSARLNRTTGQPLVRTPSAAAFSILRARAALLGEPAPVLISGPEQDLILADLIAGHAAGEGTAVRWPGSVPQAALGLRSFRDELRDLLMRAAERGLRPADLDRLGRVQGRPEWRAAASVYAEYLAVTRLRSGTPDAGARFDAAVIVDEAAEALRAWEAEVPGAARPRWGLVVVDDYQEATAATARLLHALADDAAELVLLADPDAAVQTFRGATPGLVDRAVVAPAGSELGAFAADDVVLDRVWRHGPAIRQVVRGVSEEVHGPGRAHRRAQAVERPAEVDVALLGSPAQEAAYVAYRLRAAHLHDGVPWSRLAVVVRTGGQVTALRRALLDAQVPVAVLGSDVPLRAEPAVRPLLLALTCALGEPTPDDVTRLLGSPLGGLDAVGIRRLRRALRADEVAGGGSRTSDELFVEAVADPGYTATLPSALRRPVQRLARILAAGRDAAAQPGVTALDVLWALWSTADVAVAWRRAALAGGPGGARADRDLDAVLALFTAAGQFVDRLPQAGVAVFLDHLGSQDLPADSLAEHGDAAESVAVVTAAGAAGGEWDLVVVAGVQEGVWPDLRLRDSMLGARHLVEVLAGRAVGGTDHVQARTAVLDDELRAFVVALSRARDRVVVTAVRDSDQQPSGFVDLVDPGPDDDGPDPRVRAVPHGLDLRAVVAQCRAAVEGSGPAAGLLARLAAEGVPGAAPEQWYGTAALSTSEPLWADGPVPLSPSTLESASTCALRWALEAAGGTPADSLEQSLGTLVHAVAAELPNGSAEELAEALERRWETPNGWVGAVQRRRAESMVRHLAAYLRSSGEVLGVEESFSVEVGRAVLRGTVDRLERVVGDERVRVVDLKTGRSAVPTGRSARNAQLGAYQLAVEAGAFDAVTGGAASGGACLVYVGTGNQKPTQRSQPALTEDADPGWARELLDRVVDVASRSAVTATGNDLCRRCPVTRSCPLQPEGRVVGA